MNKLNISYTTNQLNKSLNIYALNYINFKDII